MEDEGDDLRIVHEDVRGRPPRYYEAQIAGSGRTAGGHSMTPLSARANANQGQPVTTSGRQPVSASGRGSSTTGSASAPG